MNNYKSKHVYLIAPWRKTEPPNSRRQAANFSISDFEGSAVSPYMATKRLFWGLKEHLLVLMFPRHKVTSASLPTCLLLFVQRSTEGTHWRQRWCHHCDHYCALLCPIFDQASLRAVQNVCLHTARRNSDLPVLINAGPVFISLKIILIPPPQAHLSLQSDAPSQMDHLSHLMMCF